MNQPLNNSGFQIFNKSSSNINQKTIVVVGLERSGTSMVAKLLSELGIFLGAQRNTSVYEDPQIFSALENQNISQFEDLVEKFNADHNIWGWKRPQAFQYASDFEERVRNIHYIVLFRDSLSIASRNSISIGLPILDNLAQTSKKNDDLCRFVIASKKPMLCVSYEKAMADKEQFIQHLIDYLGIRVDKETRNIAIKSMVNGGSNYLLSSCVPGVRVNESCVNGRINKIDQNEISGWAKSPHGDLPANIVISQGKKLIAKIKADLPYNITDKKKRKTINIGFKYNFPSSKISLHNVRVVIEETSENLMLDSSMFAKKDLKDTHFKITHIQTNALIESAIRMEESDIKKAYLLMSLAKQIRPNGPLIEKKLKQYRALLK